MLANSETEIKLLPTRQTKLGLIRAFSGRAHKTAIETLTDYLEIAQFSISSADSETIRDEYLDDAEYSLLRKGISFRVRHKGRERRLEIKIPQTLGIPQADGVFDRREYSSIIPMEEYRRLVDLSEIPSDARSVLRESSSNVHIVCEVSDNRLLYHLRRGDALYQLSIDRCGFFDPSTGYRSKNVFMEIEIEALNKFASEDSKKLRRDLELILRKERRFTFSNTTKYQDAVRALRIKYPRPIRRLFSNDTEFGITVTLVALLSAFLLVVTSPEFAAVITCVLLGGAVAYFAFFDS